MSYLKHLLALTLLMSLSSMTMAQDGENTPKTRTRTVVRGEKGADKETAEEKKEKEKKKKAIKERYTHLMKEVTESLGTPEKAKKLRSMKLFSYSDAVNDLVADPDRLFEDATNVKKSWFKKVASALTIISNSVSTKEFYLDRGLDKEAADLDPQIDAAYAKMLTFLGEPELVKKDDDKKTDGTKKPRKPARSRS